MSRTNREVSKFLDQLDHPLRKEIDFLREVILSVDPELEENIKWNGPNYAYRKEDRITMKIHPPKTIQLVFHGGAKSKDQPGSNLINDDSGLLEWRSSNRAVATFRTLPEIEHRLDAIRNAISGWIVASSNPTTL